MILQSLPCVSLAFALVYLMITFFQTRKAETDFSVAPAEVDIHNDFDTWSRDGYKLRVAARKRGLFLRWGIVSGIALVVGFVAALAGGGRAMAWGFPTYTPTVTQTATPTITPTVTGSPTPSRAAPTRAAIFAQTPFTGITASPSAVPSIAATSTARVVYVYVTRVVISTQPYRTATPKPVTRTPKNTRTPKPTRTAYPTYTLLPTYTPYPTDTPSATVTPTLTDSPTETTTPTPTETVTPTPTETETTTPTPTQTETPTPEGVTP